jgi:hypothetical protein
MALASRRWVIWAGALALALPTLGQSAGTAVQNVVYPAFEQADDVRFDDLLDLLRAALHVTAPQYGPYTLRPSPRGMNEARYLIELARGDAINIAWSSTSVAKENQFLPIRIPLRKGLLGYRIALIAADKQPLVDTVHTRDALKTLAIGQGIGWGDVKLYQSNGLSVGEAHYNDLFALTAHGRFDLYPRGIGEVFAEYAAQKDRHPKLAVEKNLLIYYPWPYYFFFNKRDEALKSRIQTGLHMLRKNGTFDILFKKHNDAAIKQANLKDRRVIRLANPLLPPDTPTDPSLWFDPAK